MPLQNLEELLAHVDSKYRLVIVAAKRAKQLNRGAASLISTRSFKPIYVALDELASGKLQFETEGAQAELARELEEAAAKPTWFRSIVPEEAELAAEEVAEEAEEAEEAEAEAAPEEVGAEAADVLPEEDMAEGEDIAAPDEAEVHEEAAPEEQ